MRSAWVALLAVPVAVLALGGRPAAVHAEAGWHEMSGHMTMTALKPAQPGDKARADEILVAARKFADGYTDYHKALADGYEIFHPEWPQKVYHFTNNSAAIETTMHFDPARPTSLLYEKTGKDAYKLIGVMYTAPFRDSEAQLDRRVPLSVARWHLHTNLCLPPAGAKVEYKAPAAKFGLDGSIVTADVCKAAGGTFLPHLFGWMVHVYPYESDPAKVWAAGMDDDHNMDHDGMAGMKM